MLRRTFLLSASAVALVLMAPNTAAALAPAPSQSQFDLPIRTLGVIQQALNAVVNYGLTPSQRAKIFGFISSTNTDDETLDHLRTRLIDSVLLYEDTSAWNRARRIAAIDDMLRWQFPRNLDKQREAANTTLSILGSRSIRDVLNTGSGNLLARTTPILGTFVMSHSLADMKNFG